MFDVNYEPYDASCVFSLLLLTSFRFQVLDLLTPVQMETPGISYADLIVFAGNIALKEATESSLDIPFCKGRVDALEGDDLISVLEPREYDDVIVGVRDRMKIVGLSVEQMVALAARPRSRSHMIDNLGFSGSYTSEEPGGMFVSAFSLACGGVRACCTCLSARRVGVNDDVADFRPPYRASVTRPTGIQRSHTELLSMLHPKHARQVLCRRRSSDLQFSGVFFGPA